MQETLAILTENKDYLQYQELVANDKLVKLSVVGAGLESNPGYATSMFEALYDVGVNIDVISTSEIKISVLVDEDKAKLAANSVHDRLMVRNLAI